MSPLRVLVGRKSFPWLATHSSYDSLVSELHKRDEMHCDDVVFTERGMKGLRKVSRVLGKRNRITHYHSPGSAVAELYTFLRSQLKRYDIVHLLYAENQLGLLARLRRFLPSRLVVTLHQPPACWEMYGWNPSLLSCADAIITLSDTDRAYFEKYVPGRVHCVRHGMDVDFFVPSTSTVPRERRCVFSGIHLRDFWTLASVVESVYRQDPSVQFDIVIPLHFRGYVHESVLRMTSIPTVVIHHGLTDEQLRDLYCRAKVLLLPYLACTASNALLEGISCGMRIVSTDIKSIAEYTDSSFATLCPIGDVSCMTRAVMAALDAEDRSEAIHTYALQHFSWKDAAEQTVNVYRSLL